VANEIPGWTKFNEPAVSRNEDRVVKFFDCPGGFVTLPDTNGRVVDL